MATSTAEIMLRRYFSSTAVKSHQNLTEKIVQLHAVEAKKEVHSGDYVSIKPAHCMSHDNSWPVALKFMKLGATSIKYPRQIVNTLDHDIQNKDPSNLIKYKSIENFAKKYGIDFYPAGRGIGHQIMLEEGYAFPFNLTVASDSHSNTYGGIGCLGTPVVRTDAAAIWATGQTWWQVPPVAQVELKGKLPEGLSGKDIIVALCGLFNKDQVLNHAIEFTGDSLESLSVDNRLTIANMTTEWGALSGLFPVDHTVISWYKNRLAKVGPNHPRINVQRLVLLEDQMNHLKADTGAHYAKKLSIDLSSLTHYVSGPNSVKISNSVNDLAAKSIQIDKAYLVSCTNSRLSDLAAAARIICPTGDIDQINMISPQVEFYVAAASSEVENDARASGIWEILMKAGCKALPPGCGPCIGLGTGLLEAGETGISATNRNFKGRMGSKDALAYLASPAIVAASAILGRIGSPNEVLGVKENSNGIFKVGFDETAVSSNTIENHAKTVDDALSTILPGFPNEISGELVFCDADNINTDGIYPGKYTYQDHVSKETMAKVCMENYDPKFQKIVKPGDIVVSGYNFGTGSSREQAATALLAKGVNLVVAGSFGNIFARNSINNALLTLELPNLVRKLRSRYPQSTPPTQLTNRTGWFLKWDVVHSKVTVTQSSPNGPIILEEVVPELGANLQEIIVKGGLEGWVRASLK